MSQVAAPPPYPTSTTSVSPTPRQAGPASQPQYSYNLPASTLASQRSTTTPAVTSLARGPGLSPSSAVSRSQSGPMAGGQVVGQQGGQAGHPAVGGGQQQPAQQSHTMKFHSNTYTANSTAGGFGHPALPTLIPAGVSSHSHMDQEPQIPNSDISAYSQVCKPPSSHIPSTCAICIDFTLRSLVLPSRVDCLQRHLHRPH